MKRFRAVVIGCSMGGLEALEKILSVLSEDFSLPLAIVQHVWPDSAENALASILAEKTKIHVKEAEDKEPFRSGTAYIAPSNYHLLIEKDATLALSSDEKENYSRPSIDVLFESASEAFGSELLGILLTGLNSDGAKGIKKIRDLGGFIIVQDPETAVAKEMPLAALKLVIPDRILSLSEIGPFLNNLRK